MVLSFLFYLYYCQLKNIFLDLESTFIISIVSDLSWVCGMFFSLIISLLTRRNLDAYSLFTFDQNETGMQPDDDVPVSRINISNLYLVKDDSPVTQLQHTTRNTIINKRVIYIFELDCTVTVYEIQDTLQDYCTLNNRNIGLDHVYIKRMASENCFKDCSIYLTVVSKSLNMDVLFTAFKSFILKDSFFLKLCLTLHCDNSILTYNVLTPQICYQLQQSRLLNYTVIQQCTIVDHFLTEYKINSLWDKFWSINGMHIIWLSWILKYKDYYSNVTSCVRPHCTLNLYWNDKLSTIIKEAVEDYTMLIESELAIVNDYRNSRKLMYSLLLFHSFKSQLSINSELRDALENKLPLDTDTMFPLGYHRIWESLWSNHHQQVQNNYKFMFKNYCKRMANALIMLRRNEHYGVLVTSTSQVLRYLNNIFNVGVIRYSLLASIIQRKKHNIYNAIYFMNSMINNGFFINNSAAKIDLKAMGFAYKNDNYYAHEGKQIICTGINMHYRNNIRSVLSATTFIKDTSITNNKEAINDFVDNYNKDNKIQRLSPGIKTTHNDDFYKYDKQDWKVRKTGTAPSYLKNNPILRKYWENRYRLFSKFDDGIRLDYESWFSVTPEKIAKHIAIQCRCNLIIDAFCGAGGNSIHFASTCERVYAIDIDPEKIKMARHNAQIYKVEHKIEFIVGDFFCLSKRLIGDVIFLSPPWGGPYYTKQEVYDIQNIMNPKGGIQLLEMSKSICNDIAFYLPKNINIFQLITAAGPGSKVQIEQNYLRNKLIAVTAFYGDLPK